MAIVDLGTNNLTTGGAITVYTPFSYDQTLAYGIGIVLTSSNFNSIFSFIRIRALINVPGQPAFADIRNYDIQIVNIVQQFFFAASPLYRGNGTCTFTAQRLPRWKGAGDGTTVTMQLLYDDAITVPSWRA